MNLLQEFEWLGGEELASAALRVLLLNNLRTRNAVIRVLSDASRTGPLFSKSHFACDREVPTKDGQDGPAGRLDLVLEMDDAVVGIEVKFDAEFQPGQLTKYLATLQDRTGSLRKLRPGPVIEHQLFVVAPRSRQEEVRHEVQKAAEKAPAHIAFVAWEELVHAVDVSSADHDVGLERDFVSFVQRQLEFLPDLERDLPHLTRSFPPKGLELQCAFLGKIYRDALRLSGGKLSRGAEWCGYYLSPSADVWLGFRPSDEPQSVEGASLVLASLHDFELPDPPFFGIEPKKPVQLNTKGGYVPAPYHWQVSVTTAWRDQAYVRERFSAVTSRATPSPAGPPSRFNDWTPDMIIPEKPEQA